MQDLGATNLPVAQIATGTFDKTGHYYVTTNNNSGTTTFRNNLYRFDLTLGLPQALTATTLQLRNAAGTAAPAAADYFDIAYNPTDNKMYGVFADNVIYRLDLFDAAGTATTGNTGATLPATARVTTIGGTAGTQTIGTAFFDVAGRLFAYANGALATANSGLFYVVNTTTGAYTQLSTINPVSVSDGASCIDLSQRIDATKEVTAVTTVNATTYDISYAIRIRNTGTATDNFVQVSDFLRGTGATTANTTFPTATATTVTAGPAVTNLDGSTLAPNTGFTGVNGAASLLTGTQGLAAGQRALITYTVRVTFPANAVPTTAQNNTAYATSTAITPNNGYTQLANGELLTPIRLRANDASTNDTAYPVLRPDFNSTGDAPAPSPVYLGPAILGSVFEDVNYGGGAGRAQAASAGPGVSARVELYDATGLFLAAATTDATGSYSFVNGQNGVPADALLAGAAYRVRVVNSSVLSRRPGSAASLLPVQTFISNGLADDVNRVGGEAPAETDYPAGVAGGTLPMSAASSTQEIQSVTTVTLPATTAPGPRVNVDFGFNFDLIVNTNDSGQGSLRQFILNSNALTTEAGLAQVYTSAAGVATALAAGVETSIFMIPNGTAVAGQRAGLTNQFATTTGSSTAATIALASALPPLTGATTALDGSTQTRSTGNTNAAVTTTGAESTGPEVLLNLNNLGGLTISASND